MIEKILAFAEKFNMFPAGASVVCGLSGGADSTCLTLCLWELRDKLGITVEALHVNHHIRGAESDRDEQFCREFCQRLGIKITVEELNVPEYAEEKSMSLEEAARELRYEAFKRNSCGKIIATAHNANDNLETAVLNLVRGSGIKGISGIPPVRDNIVRPLLTSARSEIENYLREKGCSYVTDSTNLSNDCTRNKIRHLILPVLAEINPSAAETFISSADTLREENSFIEAETQKALNRCGNGSELSDLQQFPPLIRKRCIARLLADNSVPYTHDSLERFDRLVSENGKINVKKNLYLISGDNKLRLEKITSQKEQDYTETELTEGINKIFSDKEVLAEFLFEKNINIPEIVNTKLAIYYLDYDKIIGSLILRSRRFGDKIKLYGNNFTSSVKKLINERIPLNKRKELHFVEDEMGTVLVEGIGIASRAAPDENTKNYLKITILDSH